MNTETFLREEVWSVTFPLVNLKETIKFENLNIKINIELIINRLCRLVSWVEQYSCLYNCVCISQYFYDGDSSIE